MYVNHALSFGRLSNPRTSLPTASRPSARARSLSLPFLPFSLASHARVAPAHTMIATCAASSTPLAAVYRGAGESGPKSHVASTPPALASIAKSARADARRARGAVVFAIHVPRGGAMQFAPRTARKSEPYRAWCPDDAMGVLSVRVAKRDGMKLA